MNRLYPSFVYVSEGGGRVLDEYIEKHGRRLYGLCRTLCQNPVDADDLYQETWLKVHQKFNQYDPRRPRMQYWKMLLQKKKKTSVTFILQFKDSLKSFDSQ